MQTEVPGSDDVAVVGGGLVGSLLATFLARSGHEVTVYERRPDLRGGERSAGRSINLVLTRRGLRALERVGLADEALRMSVRVTGRMMHSGSGELSYQPYGRDESECNYSISRADLNEYLVREAEKNGVRFRFLAKLNDAEPETRRLDFVDESNDKPFATRARVIFGADGGGSALREAMEKRGLVEETIDLLGHGYKELLIPAADDGAFRIEKNALHVWPRGELMLMALPNLDGSFTVTLYLPYRGEHGFDNTNDAERVMNLFREQFPDAVPLIPDLAQSFLANPTGSLGTVRCSPWNAGDHVTLIGDAAHGIVPFFGQGMNTGFEDCTVLDQLMQGRARDAWHGLFAELSRLRKPNTDAIADMALENFVEMRDRLGDEAFLLRKRVEHRLEQELPLTYRSRYSIVMYSHVPFAVVQEVGRVQQAILDELCRDLRDAEQLDLQRSKRLIEKSLTPLLRERGVSLDY